MRRAVRRSPARPSSPLICVAVFPPPPVLGLGTIGGFKLQVEAIDAEGITTGLVRTIGGENIEHQQRREALAGRWAFPQFDALILSRNRCHILAFVAGEILDRMQRPFSGDCYTQPVNTLNAMIEVIIS
mgnify:CR=1 FL=1